MSRPALPLLEQLREFEGDAWQQGKIRLRAA
jgi:hypothetical protein